MRLIDADVFKTEYDNLITWVSHRAEKARLSDFVNDIQKQPTVKAIPIEWIKKWLNETEDDRIVCFDIRDMLADWEKENDYNKRDRI